jgi:hypothetical protein
MRFRLADAMKLDFSAFKRRRFRVHGVPAGWDMRIPVLTVTA